MAVYFAQVGRYIKVGCSANPERRVRRLFSSETRYSRPVDCPVEVAERRLLLTIPGGTTREAECHAALDDFRADGEFFIDEAPVRRFLAAAAEGRIERVTRPGGPFVPAAVATPDDDARAAAVIDDILAGRSVA